MPRGQRLNDHHSSVEQPGAVQGINHPVHEPAQEGSFPKLQHPFREPTAILNVRLRNSANISSTTAALSLGSDMAYGRSVPVGQAEEQVIGAGQVPNNERIDGPWAGHQADLLE